LFIIVFDKREREIITVKLGCDTALFNQLDLDGALKHIAWAGYKGAELCYQETWIRHIELNTNQSYIDEVKSTAGKYGMELLAISTGFGPGFQERSHEDKIKILTKVFDVAVKLSIPTVTIRPFGKQDDKETLKQELNYIKKLSERAEGRGITLAVKPHIASSIYGIATTIQMLDEIDSAALGVNLDLLQIYKGGEDPAEAVLKIGKKIVHSHFHDAKKTLRFVALDGPRETGEEEIPGRGDIDCPKILRHLKDIGYDKAIDFQTVGARRYPLWRRVGIAAEARGYLNRCLQELK
jgi:sugar phosphate isomerase/epimerase